MCLTSRIGGAAPDLHGTGLDLRLRLPPRLLISAVEASRDAPAPGLGQERQRPIWVLGDGISSSQNHPADSAWRADHDPAWTAADWTFRDPRAARQWRNGRRLSGSRYAPRARGRRQGPRGGARGGQRDGSPIRTGSACRVFAEPPQHRDGVRCRRRRPDRVHRHGTSAGIHTAASHRGPPTAARVRARRRRADCRRPLGRTRGRARASRHQAREHLRHARRSREAARFRHCPADPDRRGADRRRDGNHGLRHARRRHRRHAGLHGAGTDPRPDDRRADRSVCRRLCALRDADRRRAVQPAPPGRRHVGRAHRAGAASCRCVRARARRSNCPEMPGEGSGRAVPVGCRFALRTGNGERSGADSGGDAQSSRERTAMARPGTDRLELGARRSPAGVQPRAARDC